MEEEKNTVTIDDEEYIFEDLSVPVQHCIRQIEEVRVLADKAALEAQRYTMMIIGYTSTLREEMEKVTDTTE
tara:strand:- start:1044 stop:1259 length:216 start_codon:yes stop_codon:yes gene_type:complete